MGYISLAVLLIAAFVLAAMGLHGLEKTRPDPEASAEDMRIWRRQNGEAATFAWVVKWAAAFALVVVTAFSSAYQIPTGHVGVVSQFRSIVGQTGEGLVWVLPWRSVEAEKVQLSSKEFFFDKPETSAASKQSQDVYATVVLNYRVSPDNILYLHRTVGPEWFNTVVAPRVAQIFKAQTIKYDTVSVLPNRETIREDTARILKDQLKEYSIGDIDFLIKNIGFGKEYQEEIEATAAAVQAAQRESAKVEQEKQKAFALIEKAKGEAGAVTALATAQAEANKKLSDSITPTLVQYEMVRKLSDKVQVMMIPTGQQFIMPAELLKPTQTAR